jgi:hypothetical protein
VTDEEKLAGGEDEKRTKTEAHLHVASIKGEVFAARFDHNGKNEILPSVNLFRTSSSFLEDRRRGAGGCPKG